MSCRQSHFNSVAELQAYVANVDNGLLRSVEANGYSVTVSYYPTDLIVGRDFNGSHPSNKEVETQREKYKDYSYFVLSLSRNGKEALSVASETMDYASLVQLLSFEIGNYTSLETINDTVPTADFVLNRTYGLDESTQILIAFNKEKIKDQESFDFVLKEFGLGIGTKRFQFQSSDISRIPDLIF